jgi:epoxyqueuosine reductase QueG
MKFQKTGGTAVKEAIRSFILGQGADVCGFAGIDRFEGAPEGFRPTDVFPACKTVVAFGIALPSGLFDVPPRLIYGHFNYGSCPWVDRIAFFAAREIERLTGGRAVPMPSDGPYEYWDAENMEGRGLISMKHAAVQAGLGALGKSTLLLNERFGNRLTLGAVLADCALPSDPPAESVCLPECRLCVDGCPAGAIGEGRVIQKRCRLNTYGRNARGYDTVDCFNCRAVCPMGTGSAREGLQWPTVS